MTPDACTRILKLVPPGETSPRLETLLERAGFEVVEMETGRRALEIASETPCALLITILPIPDMSVGRLVSELYHLERSNSPTPLVLLARRPQLDAARAFEGASVRVVDRNAPAEKLNAAIADLLGIATRLSIRLPIRLDVKIENDTSRQHCRTRNLSATGMLLSSDASPPVGSVFDFEFVLPRVFEPLTGRAEVVRLSDPQREQTVGFAARFIDLATSTTSRLDRYVRAELRAR
jgi:CheY-like chemotaxis protein